MRVTGLSVAANHHLLQAAQRMALSLAVLAVLTFLLRDRIAAIDFGLAFARLSTVSLLQWAAALFATMFSFWAIGQYDVVVHRHLATGVSSREARRAGIAAIAVSQTVGAGLFSGALLRWRLLRGVSLWQATRLTLVVSLSFLGGFAVFTGAVITLTPAAPLMAFGTVALLAGLVFFALGAWQPHMLRRMHLPNARTQGRLIVLTAIDTTAACAALYVLLPPGTDLPFATLLPAFLLAHGAGLVSGTPGGIGPFEMTLLALCPFVAEPQLLAAIMGWRLVYYALPATLGATFAAMGPGRRARGPDAPMTPVCPSRIGLLLAASSRAEAGLFHQGHLAVMEGRLGGTWMIGRTAHTLVGLLDPVGKGQPHHATLHALAHQAKAEARSAAIYKAKARTAALARSHKWQVLRLGSEAVIAPQRFTLKGPATAHLRRKLRHAEAAGITLHQATPQGAAERAAVARLWARARKREFGFSMGRYAESYLALQLVIEARVDGRLVGFASFHQGMQEWTLDLMRQDPRAPDGTMQAIVTHVITLARDAGIAQLSLASCGCPPGLPSVLRRMFDADVAGLARFKQMFAPRMQPLYLAAPSRAGLLLAACEITRAIRHPPALHRRRLHIHPDDYEFAPRAQAWHSRP